LQFAAVDLNTEIAASESKVYVTWWTNKPGTHMPLFRVSNDNGIQVIGLGNQHNRISTVNESLVDELDLLM
jgi:hypothetical protein